MASSFYKGDWEQQIKQKADQYKMYPSERVWNGIYSSLHSRKKWYWLGFVLLLSGVGYYSINELMTTSVNVPVTEKIVDPSIERKATQPALLIPFKNILAVKIKSNTIKPVLEKSADDELVPIVRPELFHETSSIPGNGTRQQFVRLLVPTNRRMDQASPMNAGPGLHQFFPTIETPVVLQALPKQNEDISATQNQSEEIQKINWLQEYALYELMVPRTQRLIWQLTFSPTMNYRKLTGSRNANIQSEVKNIPIALNIEGDLDKLVNHKPALGFEMASSILYAATKNLTLKAGLQFNYSRYSIQAYSSYSTERATIALSNGYGYNLDSITSYTRIRNFGGDEIKDIQNQYFQLAAPLGLEWRLLGNERIQLKIAGSVQPTYLANRNNYLITTDYKNYTKEPSLVRRWNVNTGAEAFISYKTGGVKWQIGPQFRYQLFSSYVNKYPIQEYLMEYGVKFGVSKTIR